MAEATFAAKMLAAAFAAGASLVLPGPAAVAHADRTEAGAASDTTASEAGEPETARTARGSAAAAPSAAGARISGSRIPGSPISGSRIPGSPVAGPSPAAAVTAEADGPPVKTRRGTAGPAPVEVQFTQSTQLTRLTQAAQSTEALPNRIDGPATISPAPATPPTIPTVPPAFATVPPAGVVAQSPIIAGPAPLTAMTPARSAPRALAVMTAVPGVSAKASSASMIDNILAPIRKLFGEGTALLVRRTFFNQAPSATPVQLTGQDAGPITGTIGATDPDGDALRYSLTGTPRYGTAVVNGDGTYTYTPGTGFAGTDSFTVSIADTGFHINLLDLFRPASTSAGVAVSQGALAPLLRFQFVYGTGSQYWSSAARSALESAASKLTSYIVVDSPVTITYAVSGESSPFSSTLASAGSDFINDGSGFLQTVVQNKIQTGADANGSTADGTIDWNFGRSWGLGGSVASSEYDFRSIAMHELLHTLGFISNVGAAGSNTGRIWTVYDSYVVNAAGTRAINSDYSWNNAFNQNLIGGNGGLFFGGPNAVAAYQAKVPLYTPNPWESGSSISHLSDNTFSGSKRTLMNAVISVGPGIRELGPVELGILTDIGYTVAPGPGAPTLLFVGFVTLRLRRRKGDS